MNSSVWLVGRFAIEENSSHAEFGTTSFLEGIHNFDYYREWTEKEDEEEHPPIDEVD